MHLSLMTSIRTNNFNDEHIMEKIKKMWEEANHSLMDHKENIYGVYYDYESNYQGDYSLGVAIEGTGNNLIDIPDEATYQVYKVNARNEQGILKTWNNIWNLEKAGVLKRAYTIDYEKYFPNGEIEIHIATR